MNTFRIVLGVESLTMIVNAENKNKGGRLMFSTGLLLSAGATVVIAVTDRVLEDTGFYWLSTLLKIAIPLIGIGFAVYFLETNALLGWLR
jgi:hypothetical protein